MAKPNSNEEEKRVEGAEAITGEVSERIELLLSPPEEEMPTEDLVATPEDLDRLCNLSLSQYEVKRERDDLVRMAQHEPKQFVAVASALIGRDYNRLIPIQEETFSYKRFVQECERLKKSLRSLQSQMLAKNITKEELQELNAEAFNDSARLLALQSKAQEWLSSHYFPKVYERAENTARGEVMQYLIKQKNTRQLDAFRHVDGARIHFLDEIDYLREHYSDDAENSVGCIQGGEVRVKVPTYFSDTEEWQVFHTLVHELVHYVSRHELGKVGISDYTEDTDYTKLNECVTELVTYTIIQAHTSGKKTFLKGQKEEDLLNMSYAQYIIIVKQILSKIAIEDFVDAMLNDEGMERLRGKFGEVFDDPNALEKYATTLKDSYLSSKDRAAKNEAKKGGGAVINLFRDDK